MGFGLSVPSQPSGVNLGGTGHKVMQHMCLTPHQPLLHNEVHVRHLWLNKKRLLFPRKKLKDAEFCCLNFDWNNFIK